MSVSKPFGNRSGSLGGISQLVFAGIFFFATAMPVFAEGLYPLGDVEGIPRFSDEHIQLRPPSDTGTRPPLIVEKGDLFLGVGNLDEGFTTPWGAVWQPQLWVFGTMRSSLQMFDNGVASTASEWRNRFDLYANLQLTGTEKILIGVRPLDVNRPDGFSGVSLNDSRDGGGTENFNMAIRTLFFEGDFGSLFPGLDPGGYAWADYGFSVGRQLLQFQEGILINDEVDALGLVRNNIRLPGVANLRSSFVWGWNELGRSNARVNDAAHMFGFFNSADLHKSSVNLDLIVVADSQKDGDGVYLGAATIQRIGHYNTAFRVNSSIAEGDDNAKVGTGVLLSSEVSWTPKSSDDIVYVNTFVASGDFTQAGREPGVGGPLGALGILFASPSLGNFGSELSSASSDVAGFAVGYEAFWMNHRRSLTLEIAGRKDTGGGGFDDMAVGFEYRHRLAQRIQWQFDAHYSLQERRTDGFGLRSEIAYQF
jgi:hypothetical protein